MIESVDQKFKFVCEELYRILWEIHISVLDRILQFDEEWELGSVKRDEVDQLRDQSERTFAIHTPKIMRDECRCIVFGETSAGKSTLLNALLERNDLPNKCGRTTNCFLKIKCHNSKTFFEYKDKTKKIKEKDMTMLKKMTNFTSEDCLKTGSRINVFYRKEDCSFLRENTVIIDIPGIDTDSLIDKDIVEYCSKADIIILVVNSTQCIKRSVNNFLIKFKTKFTKLNLFLVYNHWDRLDDEDDREEVKDQLMENAKTMYKNELNYTTDDMKERYFLLSAKEQRNCKIKEDINRDIRDNDFGTFKNKLREEMGKDTLQRRYEYLEELYNVIVENIKECDNIFSKYKTNISLMLETSKKLLKTFSYSNEQIEGIIKPPLQDIFQTLMEMIQESTKANEKGTSNSNTSRKKKRKENFKRLYRSFKGNKFAENKSSQPEGNEEDDLNLEPKPFENQGLILKVITKCVFNDVGQNYKYLKREIIKYFQQKCEYNKRHCILILEKLYFRDHLHSDLLNSNHEYIKEENQKYCKEIQINQILEKIPIIQNQTESNTTDTEEIKDKYDDKCERNEQTNINMKSETTNCKTDEEKDNTEFMFVLEKHFFPFFQTPVQCLAKNSRTNIVEKIERDLTKNYLAFVEDIDKLFQKEFEEKFGNNDPTNKMEEIRKDLDQVRRQIDQINQQMKLNN